MVEDSSIWNPRALRAELSTSSKKGVLGVQEDNFAERRARVLMGLATHLSSDVTLQTSGLGAQCQLKCLQSLSLMRSDMRFAPVRPVSYLPTRHVDEKP